MKDVTIASSDNPGMAGNWHPFPPPDAGFYDLRRAFRKPGGGEEIQFRTSFGPQGRIVSVYQGEYQFEFYAHRRVHLVGKHFQVMGKRVDRMPVHDGWQFRLEPDGSNWRPFVQLYAADASGELYQTRRIDVTGQLPLARSHAEALYLVRCIPHRYPTFWKQHVEFTEEKLQ